MKPNKHKPKQDSIDINSGYIHIYTGNGKGKTTAALGLALRSVGAGKRVFIGQFMKSMAYSEDNAIKILGDGITLRKYGIDCFIVNSPTEKDIECARKGLDEMQKILESDKYDMVIFDEACVAIFFKLFTAEDLINVIQSRPERTEIVITGRYAPPKLIEIADLVTEMVEIKHYYNKGMEARIGIEK